MGRQLAMLGQALIGGRAAYEDLNQVARYLSRMLPQRQEEEEQEILPARYFEEKIGRNKRDIIGATDFLDLGEDDDDDDDDAGYIGYIGKEDIIGALEAASLGKHLTRKQRVALREAKKAAKKAMRAGNEDAALSMAMRQAYKPIIRTDEENILRKLNMPLSTISVPANGTNTFAIVVQESMRLERLFLYPVGGNYDNLWVGDIFCGRQTNSVVPGNEEPMINYSPTAVDSGIEGFTVNYGLTLRILIRNGTGAPVTVGGKIKGRTLTT